MGVGLVKNGPGQVGHGFRDGFSPHTARVLAQTGNTILKTVTHVTRRPMLNLQAPIQKLMWEERASMGTVPAPWGPYLALGRGGWVVLTKGDFGLPMPEVVVLGKCLD